MEIRRFDSDRDLEGLQNFFARVPEGDRTFFKEDLDADAVARWATDPRGRRAIACDGGEVVGYVAVVSLHGWSDHVGEIRLVVDPERRRQGIGRELAQRALVDAVECGLEKVSVEVVADQDAAVEMFRSLGFQPEAMLRDHVRDKGGDLRDLIVLSHPMSDQWSAMETAGIADAVGS